MRALLRGWEECLADTFANKWGFWQKIVALKSKERPIAVVSNLRRLLTANREGY
jgi:hypothetical protein